MEFHGYRDPAAHKLERYQRQYNIGKVADGHIGQGFAKRMPTSTATVEGHYLICIIWF
jgi:hypothetical protein